MPPNIVRQTRSLFEWRKPTVSLLSANVLGRPTVKAALTVGRLCFWPTVATQDLAAVTKAADRE